jgi:hypothetical protein
MLNGTQATYEVWDWINEEHGKLVAEDAAEVVVADLAWITLSPRQAQQVGVIPSGSDPRRWPVWQR